MNGLDALDRGLAKPPRMAPQPVDVPEPDGPATPPLHRAGGTHDPLGVPEILDLFPPPRPGPSRQGTIAAGQAPPASRSVRPAPPPPPPAPRTAVVPVSVGAHALARTKDGSPGSRHQAAPFGAGLADAAGPPRFDDDLLEDLPRESARLGLRDYVVLGVGALALALMGAAGGAYVFQERIARIVVTWLAVPPLPSGPRLTAPSPIDPLPVPAEDAGAR